MVDQSPIVPVFIFCLRGCSSEFLSPIVASPASFGENHDYPRKLNWKECFKLADFPAVWYLSVEKGNQLVLNRTWNVCCYMFCYMLCYVWICVFLVFSFVCLFFGVICIICYMLCYVWICVFLAFSFVCLCFGVSGRRRTVAASAGSRRQYPGPHITLSHILQQPNIITIFVVHWTMFRNIITIFVHYPGPFSTPLPIL